MAQTTLERPQHLRALDRANQVRLATACVSRAIRLGQVSAAEAVNDPRAGSLTVLQFLSLWHRSTHGRRGVADEKAFGVLLDRGLWEPGLPPSPMRRVRDLTARQKALIVEACATSKLPPRTSKDLEA